MSKPNAYPVRISENNAVYDVDRVPEHWDCRREQRVKFIVCSLTKYPGKCWTVSIHTNTDYLASQSEDIRVSDFTIEEALQREGFEVQND